MLYVYGPHLEARHAICHPCVHPAFLCQEVVFLNGTRIAKEVVSGTGCDHGMMMANQPTPP